MKFRIVLFLFITIILSSEAQTKWYSILPELSARYTFVKNDTLITFGSGRIGHAFIILEHYSALTTGKYYYTDTIDYFTISGDSTQTTEFYNPDQFYMDSSTGKFRVGFSYSAKVNGRYKWRSSVFDINPLSLFTHLNNDTFDTKVGQFSRIGNNFYSIEEWTQCPVPNLCNVGFKLVKFKDSQSLKTIRTQFNSTCPTCHFIEFVKVHEDIKDGSYLFLQQIDKSDFYGDANVWQGQVVKLDTNGIIKWKSQPNNNDSVNTSSFRLVQKPDGNLICCWTDDLHTPHKHPSKDSYLAQLNDSSTLWFAEIDYQTGKVLWRKSLRTYIRGELRQGTGKLYAQLVYIYDVKRVGNNLIWVGTNRKVDTLKPYGKDLTIILKTDLYANPVWIRQLELYPGDSGDIGMTPYHLATLENNGGYILTGDYENQYGQASNGQFWHKGALLRVDRNGCFIGDCQEVDTLEPIDLRLYPNPAQNIVVIEFLSTFEEWEIRIFDIQGRLLMSEMPLAKRHTMNLDNYSSGIYFFNLINTKSNAYKTFKVIIDY